ncbi:hypothetical protein NP233_g12131 [Leucocoprinus birnbaumii]|uniref:Tyr recombinase domain-containing protein n=1 Tax=Leucocoprinus birnbaumii TaxID=56174 RepID=A0AAD5YJQ8_9AGAR|nr:hypothetical protein NP233_g12131 [Leucocoprinus birnbaumii]
MYNPSSSESSSTDIEALRKLIADNTLPDSAIEDDLDGEQDALDARLNDGSMDSDPDDSLHEGLSDALMSSIHEFSRGVSDGTHKGYQRLAVQCEAFLSSKKYITPGTPFFSKEPSRLAPYLIILWIMNACDEILPNGEKRPPTEIRSSYTHAMKMRAAVTYNFGRVFQLGGLPWHYNQASDKMEGNPSISPLVSTYMLSLRRRKVRDGITAVSVRAITPELLAQLFKYNKEHPGYNLTQPIYEGALRNMPKIEQLRKGYWCGPVGRRLLNLVYALAFTCLLRIDEALKIQHHEIEPKIINGKSVLVVTLPFRKTDQFGDIKPFVLHELPQDMEHLCPVRAYSWWVLTSRQNTGYVFRRLNVGDRLGEGNTCMTSSAFLEMFRTNLTEIGVDYIPYGTHSFRRGGTQWMSVYLRKPWRDILSNIIE